MTVHAYHIDALAAGALRDLLVAFQPRGCEEQVARPLIGLCHCCLSGRYLLAREDAELLAEALTVERQYVRRTLSDVVTELNLGEPQLIDAFERYGFTGQPIEYHGNILSLNVRDVRDYQQWQGQWLKLLKEPFFENTADCESRSHNRSLVEMLFAAAFMRVLHPEHVHAAFYRAVRDSDGEAQHALSTTHFDAFGQFFYLVQAWGTSSDPAETVKRLLNEAPLSDAERDHERRTFNRDALVSARSLLHALTPAVEELNHAIQIGESGQPAYVRDGQIEAFAVRQHGFIDLIADREVQRLPLLLHRSRREVGATVSKDFDFDVTNAYSAFREQMLAYTDTLLANNKKENVAAILEDRRARWDEGTSIASFPKLIIEEEMM